ncbi:hypothetical protein LUU34_00023200 [Aix galericulata]|nr:hypothetical protein LUU34_00023200 [Aix galericulata]
MAPPSPSTNSSNNSSNNSSGEQLSKTNLYIRGLPPGTTDQDLIKLCQPTWDAEPASGVPGLSADSWGWALVVWPGLLLQQAIPWGCRGELRVRPCAISEVPITS